MVLDVIKVSSWGFKDKSKEQAYPNGVISILFQRSPDVLDYKSLTIDHADRLLEAQIIGKAKHSCFEFIKNTVSLGLESPVLTSCTSLFYFS